jgi:hypothetical protein
VEAADLLTARLAVPRPPTIDHPWAQQLLAAGSVGIALLHIERARAGLGTWVRAHAWIQDAVDGDVHADDSAALFAGVPAVAFALNAAGHYPTVLTDLDQHVAALVHRRAQAAMDRMDAGVRPGFAEYDVFLGLAGLGALLLRRDPGGTAMQHVLEYVVALTRPLPGDAARLPGWWVSHDPNRWQSARYAGGHGNFGLAHGITGPLALLSLAVRRNIVVDGQTEAIATVLDWLDRWRQDGPTGHWWPETIATTELRPRRPARPSWCYGTPGIARAGQLAAIATGDRPRRQLYENALLDCLTDPDQLDLLVDPGLCHGIAGTYQTAWRAAADSESAALARVLPDLADRLAATALNASGHGPGFLEGDAGTALALITAARGSAPISGWDSCLLIT